jgi:hypothetical protein
MPTSSKLSAPFGILQNLVIGLNSGIFVPARPLVSKMDSTKKGNSEGITVRTQRSKPSCAPCSAVLLSRIRKSIAIDERAIVTMRADRFIGITSKEFMRQQEKQHSFKHRILPKGVLQ